MEQGPPRKIIHVDMDCFYAAVEAKYRPELKGKALAIGGLGKRSVLCTASYEARKYKVRSAMPTELARQLCPHLIVLPPQFELYKKESMALREILQRFSSLIEPLSLDEAFLEVSASEAFSGSATLIAKEIRKLVKQELGLAVSAGVSNNKFLAKIASDWNKPDGLFVIRPQDVPVFMKNLPIEKIYGVGNVSSKKMHERGLHFCSDIQLQSLEQLTKAFGKSRAHSLYWLSRGIDHRPVDNLTSRKSLSVEETFPSDISTLSSCLSFLPQLYRDWETRIQKAQCHDKIRSFVVKVKFFDFKSTTHESSSKNYPKLQDFEKLFRKVWERRPDPVRLIGLGTRLKDDKMPSVPEQLKLAL